MLSTTTDNTILLRNYIITLVSVTLLSMGVADMINNPARVAQQDKLDNYGRVISAGLVNQAKNSFPR